MCKKTLSDRESIDQGKWVCLTVHHLEAVLSIAKAPSSTASSSKARSP